jgi:hypothetical protein
MGLLSFIYPTLCLAVALAGVWLYRRFPKWGRLDRVMIASLPWIAFIVLVRIIHESLLAPLQVWDTVHLLPAYLLADGKRLFYPAASGPILDMMYGPMTAVAYWPVTCLTREPAWAAGIAKYFTVFYFLLPAAFMAVVRPRPTPRQSLFVAYAFLGYVYFCFQSPALSGSCFWNHADSPSLCWSGLACLIVFFRKAEKHFAWMFLAALCTALAMWTKQVTAPLVLGLFIYLWIADGAGAAMRYWLCFLLASALTLAVFVPWHGFQEMWFNLVVNPSLEPWNKDLVKVEGWAIVELMQRMRWVSILIACYFVYEWHKKTAPGGIRQWCSVHRWVLFVIVGICMIPTALMGRMKVGGDLNALSFATYFLATGTYAILLQFIMSPRTSADYGIAQGVLKKLIYAYVVSSMIMQLPTLSYYFLCLPKYLHRLESNPPSVSCRYSREHPGVVYMPWNCLETYLAEGTIYHFEYAVFDREMGNLPPDPVHFKSGLPAAMRYVAYPFNEQARHVMKYFPEYRYETTLPDLPPGWTVYTSNPAEGKLIASSTEPPDPDRVRRVPRRIGT